LVHDQINPNFIPDPHNNSNPPSNVDNTHRNNYIQLISQLCQELATKDSIEMIHTFSRYYIIGLVYRYIALSESIELFLAEYGQLDRFDADSGHPVGVVCDSIDVLVGDLIFVSLVGDKAIVGVLDQFIDRLLFVKTSLFGLLIGE
jgi:hypothetical protein